jgi:hypothetical protein
MSFLEGAIQRLSKGNYKSASTSALIAIANELKLIRQQLGYILQKKLEWS